MPPARRLSLSSFFISSSTQHLLQWILSARCHAAQTFWSGHRLLWWFTFQRPLFLPHNYLPPSFTTTPTSSHQLHRSCDYLPPSFTTTPTTSHQLCQSRDSYPRPKTLSFIIYQHVLVHLSESHSISHLMPFSDTSTRYSLHTICNLTRSLFFNF